MVMAYWLVDVEDNRLVVYWELQGARQALEDLLRKLGDRLPEDVRVIIEATLGDIRDELWELEGQLAGIITVPTSMKKTRSQAGAGDGRCGGAAREAQAHPA